MLDIVRLRRSTDPSDEEAYKWLTLLKRKGLSNEAIAAICHCSGDSVMRWQHGTKSITPAAIRGLWLAWSYLYRPDNLRDLFTVATWGRFTHAARFDKMWHRGRYRGKEPPKVGVKKADMPVKPKRPDTKKRNQKGQYISVLPK